MKKLFRLLLAPALAAGLITSCSTDHDVDFGYGKNHELSAKFTAGIAASRVTDNNWDKEDIIGIYAVRAGQELADATIYKGNSKYTTMSEAGSGDFSPASDDDAIVFKRDGEKLDFIAYYPYQTTVTDYKLAIDVSDQSKLSKIDYLYSNNAKGHNRENKEVPLQFKHQLTQLVLNITGDSDLGDLATLKLAAEGFVPTGSLNLKDGVVTVEGTDAKVLNLTATKADAGVTMRAIVLPGQNMKNTSFVFDLNGMKFKAWIPEDLVLESNARVTYKVELSTDGSVLASPTGTIEDWTDVEGGEVILEPEGETPSEEGITVDNADKNLSFEAAAAAKTINVKAPATLAWTASTAETWITLENAEAIGTADLKIKLEANTGAAREGSVTIAPKTGARTAVVISVKQAAGEVVEEKNLLFPGSDFEDWDAFLGSIMNGKPVFGEQAKGEGVNGSTAFALRGTVGKNNGYSFTAFADSKTPKEASAITFMVKGTTSTKSLSLNVYDNAGVLTYFNLDDVGSTDLTIESSSQNAYDGDIDTQGEWVKITLNVDGLKLNTNPGENLFAVKVGKTGVYDLLIDDITFE